MATSEGQPIINIRPEIPIYTRGKRYTLYGDDVAFVGSTGLIDVTGQLEFAELSCVSNVVAKKNELGTEIIKERKRMNAAEDFIDRKGSEGSFTQQTSTVQTSSGAFCYDYNPKVPQMGSFYVIPEDGWRREVPSLAMDGGMNGGMGHEISMVVFTNNANIDQREPPLMELKNWNCSDATISVTLYFLTEGSAGIFFRAKENGSRTVLLLETTSQMISVHLEGGETSPRLLIAQTISPTALIAHEGIALRLNDRDGVLKVSLLDEKYIQDGIFMQITVNGRDALEVRNSEMALTSSIPRTDAIVGRGGGGGLIVARGTASFGELRFRGVV